MANVIWFNLQTYPFVSRDLWQFYSPIMHPSFFKLTLPSLCRIKGVYWGLSHTTARDSQCDQTPCNIGFCQPGNSGAVDQCLFKHRAHLGSQSQYLGHAIFCTATVWPIDGGFLLYGPTKGHATDFWADSPAFLSSSHFSMDQDPFCSVLSVTPVWPHSLCWVLCRWAQGPVGTVFRPWELTARQPPAQASLWPFSWSRTEVAE